MGASSAASSFNTGAGLALASGGIGAAANLANGIIQFQESRRSGRAAQATARAEERRFRRQGRRELGSIAARAGASGIQFTGSPLESYLDSLGEVEEDAQLIRHGGEVRRDQIRRQGDFALAGGIGGFLGGALQTGALYNDLDVHSHETFGRGLFA